MNKNRMTDTVNKTIVIPVYKEEMDQNEMISFHQCLKIMGNHSITLVIPETLDVKKYTGIAEEYGIVLDIERFKGYYFENIKGYNRLMLSKEFYQRFQLYEYILIYQLDCFVFRNDLEYWCQLGYDYIGSPYGHRPHIKGFPLIKKRLYNFKKRLSYKIKKKKQLKAALFEDTTLNGGFSLRKVNKFINVIDIYEKNGKIDRFRNTGEGYLQEDIFFAFEAKRELKIPYYKFASNFSVEDFPLWYDASQSKRPFGCHGWTKDYLIKDWIPVIEEWGYKVDFKGV